VELALALPEKGAQLSRKRPSNTPIEEAAAPRKAQQNLAREEVSDMDVEALTFEPQPYLAPLDMSEDIRDMGQTHDEDSESAWDVSSSLSPPYPLKLLTFRLSSRDMRLGEGVCTLLVSCDVPEAEIPPDGRPVDARCLRPEGWLSSCVVDRLLDKFITWVDAETGLLEVVSSSESYALYEQLKAQPLGPWSKQWPAQRRLQGRITQSKITILLVVLGGHWAVFIFENRGTKGVVHIYNPIATYGRSVLHRLAGLATRHYAGAGRFPATWNIRHEECPQQSNSYDCGLFVLAISMEIGGRIASGFGPPPTLLLPDLRHLRTRLAILLTESLADWTYRVGPRCY
jgi:hypothetical protein